MTQKITSLTRSNIDALKQEVDLREKVRKQCVNLELRPYKDGLVGCCPFIMMNIHRFMFSMIGFIVLDAASQAIYSLVNVYQSIWIFRCSS